MARYIDVDKKVEELENKIDGLTRLVENRPYDYLAKRDIGTYESFLYELNRTPIADVVEVVRCNDCSVPHNKWTGCPNLNGLVPPPDFYCAKGERK
jgi:hypothetical protein